MSGVCRDCGESFDGYGPDCCKTHLNFDGALSVPRLVVEKERSVAIAVTTAGVLISRVNTPVWSQGCSCPVCGAFWTSWQPLHNVTTCIGGRAWGGIHDGVPMVPFPGAKLYVIEESERVKTPSHGRVEVVGVWA